MKRYDFSSARLRYMAGELVEDATGIYVLHSDMIKETIPRPDPEEVRKAVINYRDAIQRECLFDAVLTGEEELTLLKMMGVE